MRTFLSYEIKLQIRQGFWTIYMILTAIYLLILFNLPPAPRLYTTLVIILFDTSLLGVTFVGAVVLLEKQQNVLHSLFITPVSAEKYILTKALSLTTISLIASTAILFLPNQFSLDFFILLLVILLSSFLFTITGIAVSMEVKSLNGYIWNLILFSILISAPIIPYLLFEHSWALTIFPQTAILDLMLKPINNIASYRIISDFVIILIWIYIAFRIAVKQVNKKYQNIA